MEAFSMEASRVKRFFFIESLGGILGSFSEYSNISVSRSDLRRLFLMCGSHLLCCYIDCQASVPAQ